MFGATNLHPDVEGLTLHYNGAATIDLTDLTIRFLLSQSFTDFELLLSDDGPKDAIAEIVRRYDDPRIVFLADGSNRGHRARLNECIDRARGKYFAIVDHDDICFPQRFERQ